MSTSLSNAAASESEVVLRWQVHLARQEPLRLTVVTAVIAVTGTLACMWYGSIFPAIVMAFVLFGALSDFLLPVTYTFTATHASASSRLGKRIMAWSDVKTIYVDDAGLKLSPLSKRSRLEAYRGVYVRFGDRKDEIIEAVNKLRPKNG